MANQAVIADHGAVVVRNDKWLMGGWRDLLFISFNWVPLVILCLPLVPVIRGATSQDGWRALVEQTWVALAIQSGLFAFQHAHRTQSWVVVFGDGQGFWGRPLRFYLTPALLFGRLGSRDRDDVLAECLTLTHALLPGYDYSREITLTDTLSLGDTLLVRDGGRLVAFALCHTAPLVEGRTREELRVLKLVVSDPMHFEACCRALMDYARRSGTRRVAFRVQGEYVDAYARLIAMGARVRWTDLRMTLAGYSEPRTERGIVLSNWEI